MVYRQIPIIKMKKLLPAKGKHTCIIMTHYHTENKQGVVVVDDDDDDDDNPNSYIHTYRT